MIDTHAHLNFPQFEGDLAAVLDRAKSAGVNQIVNIGTDATTSAQSVELADQFEYIRAAVGIHPHASDKDFDSQFKIVSALATHPRVVAIGEIGLDYFRPEPAASWQVTAFRRQLELALAVNKPIVIHSRDAYSQTLSLLEEVYLPHLPTNAIAGILHSFTGTAAEAKQFIAAGFYLGINNISTYPTSHALREAVAATPLDRLVLETDCPYLPPQALRGQRSEPKDVASVAETIAEIKNLPLEEVVSVTTTNANRIFHE